MMRDMKNGVLTSLVASEYVHEKNLSDLVNKVMTWVVSLNDALFRVTVAHTELKEGGRGARLRAQPMTFGLEINHSFVFIDAYCCLYNTPSPESIGN